MEARTLQFIATACLGELANGSPEARVSRLCTDSRQAKAGDLFFALSGDRFDGHAFLADVVRKGAAAVVIERGRGAVDFGGCAVIAVDSPRKALGRLAGAYRKDFALPVIAVGGSNGKTTAKDLIAAVLRQKLATLSSEASFNNDIGVPLTLLKLEKTHQAVVVEAGTNHPGELETLVKMIQPDYGVITSIGREHLEFFGDLAGVAREEGWLAELLPAAGKLFINGDGEWTNSLARRSRAAVVRIGLADRNEWRASNLRVEKQGVAFRVEGPRQDLVGDYRVHLLGRHQAVNALFAIALGAELGLGREDIERGLAECQPAKMRLQLWEINGVRVLDDAYNANADSMLAALQTLQELPCKGRRVAVLGDMAELGAQTEAAHEEIGRRAAELGIGQLFAVGKMAAVTARGARGAGLNRVLEFADVESAASAVKSFVKNGDVLLLKASRASHLERVAEMLRAGEGRRN
jgi:UDP-N-acetylmuramoyl-tripeptide--D-alanyl-D-alanine ligase